MNECNCIQKTRKNTTNIAVWGLGHVGQITAAYLSEWTSHCIFGVDTKSSLVALLLHSGNTSNNEMLRQVFDSSVKSGRLALIHHAKRKHLPRIDVHFICVETPTLKKGTQNVQRIESVCANICSLSSLDQGEIIVVRSTVLPGTAETIIIPQLEALSGKHEGTDFYVLVIPCFAREVDFIEDLRKATRVVLGSSTQVATDRIIEILKLKKLRIFKTTTVEAELAKYVDNAFHALKVVFANEVATVAKRLSASSNLPLEILCLDERLNISTAYLEPGEAYGGRCLPKDMLALDGFLRRFTLSAPLLHAINRSNLHQARLREDSGRK